MTGWFYGNELYIEARRVLVASLGRYSFHNCIYNHVRSKNRHNQVLCACVRLKSSIVSFASLSDLFWHHRTVAKSRRLCAKLQNHCPASWEYTFRKPWRFLTPWSLYRWDQRLGFLFLRSSETIGSLGLGNNTETSLYVV